MKEKLWDTKKVKLKHKSNNNTTKNFIITVICLLSYLCVTFKNPVRLSAAWWQGTIKRKKSESALE